MELDRRSALRTLAAGAAALGCGAAGSAESFSPRVAEIASGAGGPAVASVVRAAHGPEVRFSSASLICAEGLEGGRWVTKSWQAAGAARSQSRWAPNDAFAISIQAAPDRPGAAVTSGWHWVSGRQVGTTKSAGTVFAVELENPAHQLRVRLLTLLDGTPTLARWMEITNLANHPVALTELAPWSGSLWSGDMDSEVRVLLPRRWRPQWAGWVEWSALSGGQTAVEQSHGLTYAKPYFVLHHARRGEYIFAQLAWPASYRICFERNASGTSFAMGPTAQQALRVLAPGETVTTPATHMAYVRGDFDGVVQAMHEHVRRSVTPTLNPHLAYRSQYLLPADQPLTVYHGAAYDESNVKKCVDVAAAAGLETIIVDGPTWCQTYGEWLRPNPQRFPHGLAPIREYAHQKGLLFGLYFELEGGRPGYCAFGTCIGNWTESRVYQRHPEWFTQPGYVLNLAHSDAAAYFDRTLNEVIEFYGLDLYRHDFNAPAQGEGSSTPRGGFVECDYWRHYEAFYRAFNRARRRHPNLILQQASAGGTRLDLATVGTFHESYVTDVADCPSGYQMLDGVSVCLPPELLVFPNGMSGRREPDYETELRAAYALGNTPMLFNAMLPKDLSAFSARQRHQVLRYARLYKRFIRPLLSSCLVFHHSPVNASGGVESGGWLAMEFSAPDQRRGWATCIQLHPAAAAEYHFRPRGLDPQLSYDVFYDNTGRRKRVSGARLLREGITISTVPHARSELLLYSAV